MLVAFSNLQKIKLKLGMLSKVLKLMSLNSRTEKKPKFVVYQNESLCVLLDNTQIIFY